MWVWSAPDRHCWTGRSWKRPSYVANDTEQGERLHHEAGFLKQCMDRKGLELQWDGHLGEQRSTARSTKARNLLQEADRAFRSERRSADRRRPHPEMEHGAAAHLTYRRTRIHHLREFLQRQ